jgi:hypothetical protein
VSLVEQRSRTRRLGASFYLGEISELGRSGDGVLWRRRDHGRRANRAARCGRCVERAVADRVGKGMSK